MNSDSSDRRLDDDRAGSDDASKRVRRQPTKKRDGKLSVNSVAALVFAGATGILTLITIDHENKRKEIENRYKAEEIRFHANQLRCSQEETQAALRQAILAELDLESLMKAVREQGGDPKAMIEERQ